MIISNIIGGLGNQMFQYAAGRSLSLKYDVSLSLDISGFRSYAQHNGFELQSIFDCNSYILSDRELHQFLGWQSLPLFRRLLLKPSMKFLRPSQFILEPHFEYWQDFENLPIDSYLYGYWQSYKYFAGNEEKIRNDFVFKQPVPRNNIEITEKIVSLNSISLHVRRGDYLNNSSVYEICSTDYYNSAITFISERVVDPHFFIFSDDIEWVKSNLKIPFLHTYVNLNYGAQSYNDMRLMSLCKHHIIANSTFSWWGAWLNPSLEKIVIAPKKWFAKNIITDDLFPDTWNLL